ncbi:tRNA-dihydrouridine synthase A [Candidatus Liberibacter solanacearum]|uniref:tRNA dihydrouridine(20/20a) synthase DusA n=1 Tax=Candidatus Liberibacter solanacearum TaxID=556287 RepID=UPI0005FA59B1|nr:tRNA dihydrouridine(20/20a) synthase DusA [Candidatus Liberibacter solanacearum]KJZ81196.1 tRNA-dihydrouridine synthase A [Candidatus Liberibacter solanacearum]KQC48929.1 tRNA-dihydrouridine synthase A [Candidatus Liberibacter solanacearum]
MLAYVLDQKFPENNSLLHGSAKVFSVAPMVDWTDRHYRFFARLLTNNAILYTEMIVADAILYGNRQNILGFSTEEKPLALQIGGSDIAKLVEAAKIVEDFGYNEINFNVGCPSPNVHAGSFGACLMLTPESVGDCIAAMQNALSIPVTVKCRIGVDNQIPAIALRNLIKSIKKSGVKGIWIHARKAILGGLSPKDNRKIPKLDYDIIYEIKKENPDLFIGLNGGLDNMQQILQVLPHVDGVMVGRSAYQNSIILASVDEYFMNPLTGSASKKKTIDKDFWKQISDSMRKYADRHIKAGGKLSHITRHMIGLFHGFPHARRCRHILTVEANAPTATHQLIEIAFNLMIESLEK